MEPLTFLLPVVYALFIWWFSTGLIFMVYGRPRSYQRMGFALVTLMMVGAMGGLLVARHHTEPLYVYLASTCGVVVWGWQAAGYYLGFITGPRPAPAAATPRSRNGRFRHALRASLFHELTIVGFVVLLAGISWAQPNRWGLWVFLALWIMHSLAKLNIFLGVRNFRIEFLPEHFHHLAALLERRAANPLLPPTVLLASSISLALIYQAITPGTLPGHSAGYLFVGTMVALGTFEIALLVLPLPVTLLGWNWRKVPEQRAEG